MRCKNIIFNYFKKHGIRYFVGLLLVVASTVLTASIPKILGDTINVFSEAVGSADPRSYIPEIVNKSVYMILFASGAFVMRFIWRYLIMGFTRSVELHLRQEIFTKLQTLSPEFYVKNNTGDLITRSILDAQVIRMMFGMGLVGIIDVITVTATAISYMVASVSLRLTVYALIPMPLMLYALVKLRTLMRRRFTVVQAAVSDISSKVQENMTGIRVVKAFSQEESENRHFEELSRKKWKAEMAMMRISAVINPLTAVVFGIVYSAFIYIGGRMVVEGSLDIGSFIAFNSYIGFITDPINRVSRIIQIWQRGVVSMSRMDLVLTAEPTVTDRLADPSIQELPSVELKVDIDEFYYPDTERPALKDVHFEVPAGGVLAVMGPTGSGKTTLMNLLMRMWNPPEESVSISGSHIENIPLNVLRSAAAYVPQDTFLFSDSVRNNIRFYDDRISDEDVETAAKAAAVHENILEFAKGYETAVGERGMTVSGGQKQRISIARALSRKPAFLLLDDCLSAVDAETEHLILGNLREYIKGCTTVLVTHRIAAAGLADRILLLKKDGSVSAIGTHDELLQSSKDYQNLVAIAEAGKEELRNA